MSEVPMVLPPYEIEAAAGGKLKVVIRPCEVQAKFMQRLRNSSFEMSQDGGFDCDVSVVVPPAQPGDVIVGLEEWHVWLCGAWPLVSIKGADPCERPPISFEQFAKYERLEGWQPAATMPPEFARFRWTVDRVECKRLRSIEPDDLSAGGLMTLDSVDDFYEGTPEPARGNWDAAFPAYPWENDPWVFMHWLGGE